MFTFGCVEGSVATQGVCWKEDTDEGVHDGDCAHEGYNDGDDNGDDNEGDDDDDDAGDDDGDGDDDNDGW